MKALTLIRDILFGALIAVGFCYAILPPGGF
jgi:hypothetical protein